MIMKVLDPLNLKDNIKSGTIHDIKIDISERDKVLNILDELTEEGFFPVDNDVRSYHLSIDSGSKIMRLFILTKIEPKVYSTIV